VQRNIHNRRSAASAAALRDQLQRVQVRRGLDEELTPIAAA
jgi:hypothetical protein